MTVHSTRSGRTLSVHGGSPLRGTVRVPGCKGVSHRALVAAAIADGESAIANLATGQDVAHTRAAIEAFGVATREGVDGRVVVDGHGIDAWREPASDVDCGNSGTTMRFLAGACAGRAFRTVLVGDASLSARPMARVLDPLRAMGAEVEGSDGGNRAPLTIHGGALRGRRHELAVASGQVKTALILAGLQADGVTEIVEPAPSRDHTERLLRFLGAPVVSIDAVTTRVTRGAPSPFALDIPGDPSSAAFFVVAATLVPDSNLVLQDVLANPGRLAYLDILREMGASIHVNPKPERGGEPVADLVVEAASLRATTIRSHEAIVDELPVLAIAAAFADGVTDIRDAAELRVKESNRIATLVAELTHLGAVVEELDDGLRITGRAADAPGGAGFAAHGDHRIAMAAAVGALALPGGSSVEGWDAVDVSYPEFAAHLAIVGGGIA
jgi:3-phosphoshikimate 1-carboxyvinyltransferase